MNLDEENEKHLQRTARAVNARAMAAMLAMWDRMPWDQTIEISGGEQAVIAKFIEPRERDGRAEFLFNIQDTHGDWHLEVLVRVNSWGGWQACWTDDGNIA